MNARKIFINKNFLTKEEKKYGNPKILENVNKSFEKLSTLQDRDWS